MKYFYQIPDTDVLNSSLDAYLFLRYMKLLCVICLFGVLLTWPTLLPLHYYGGAGNKQLDSLTFGNIADTRWCFVHAVEAWIFFGRSYASKLTELLLIIQGLFFTCFAENVFTLSTFARHIFFRPTTPAAFPPELSCFLVFLQKY